MADLNWINRDNVDKPSERDSKYKQLPGEIWDKKHGVLWNCWTRPEILRACEEFEFRDNDILLATYPKSGTTIVQEALWLMDNHVDTVQASRQKLHHRVPFLELFVDYDDGFRGISHISVLEGIPANQRRIIKTHVPYRYLKENLQRSKVKVVNVMRNPKDTMVSYYHFYKGILDYGPWEGDFNDYFQLWMDGHIVCGDWFDITKEWWRAHQSNPQQCCVVYYEDLLRSPVDNYRKIMQHCQLPELSDQQMARLVKHTSFNVMQNNASVNMDGDPSVTPAFRFIRKGQSGNWKNYFTVAQNEHFDRICQQHASDLPTFTYE